PARHAPWSDTTHSCRTERATGITLGGWPQGPGRRGRATPDCAVSRPETPLDHVTPYDRFAMSDTEMEALLVSGALQKELVDYFGATEYRDLARLARKAAATPVRDA